MRFGSSVDSKLARDISCASCGRHFTPDDLQLDATGGWICAECTRKNSSAEAAVSLEKSGRARRRMQLLGIAFVVAALFVIGWGMIATGRAGDATTA